MTTEISHRRHRAPQLLAATLLTGAGLALVSLTADAHVRVHADNTASGAFSALTFRVPTESDTASTIKLEVTLPSDTPFLYVSTKPLSGWTATTSVQPLPKPVESGGATITKAVRTVTWTAAAGHGIKPGEYQEFSISVGPLPAPGSIALPAAQTYSDGKVVRWEQPTPASGDEPELPAPVLVITAATAGGAHGDDGDPVSAAPGPAVAATAAGGGDRVAQGLGAAGLVVGAAGLVTAAVAVRRGRGSVGGSAS